MSVASETVAHICGAAIMQSGPVLVTLPMASFTRFVTPLTPGMLAAVLAGNTYISVQTAAYTGGESAMCALVAVVIDLFAPCCRGRVCVCVSQARCGVRLCSVASRT